MAHRAHDGDLEDLQPQRLSRRELTRLVPHLAPEAVQSVVRHAGLERFIDLVEALNPAQLAAVLDLDLWRGALSAGDEEFDADRFGEWLEALVDRDAALAARVVARLDRALVVTGLSLYVRVHDPGVLIPTEATDDEAREPTLFVSDSLSVEIGGYVVQARRPDTWDAIVAVLVALATEDVECFHGVLTGCRRLSNAGHEADGLDELLEAPEQHLREVTLARDDRREALGFCTTAEARAFLALARRRPPRAQVDPEVVTEAPAAIKCVPAAEELVRERQLAFLANALVAGCRLQSRSFTPWEAATAVGATCSLGLARRPAPTGVDHLVRHDLIALFEEGWAALHREVSLYTATGLIEILRGLRSGDSDTLEGLHGLRRSLETHLASGTPWLAHEALDVLSVLDLPACHGLRGLLSECPMIPAALTATVERRSGRIDPSAFAFIATDADIQVVRAFMACLPRLLAG